jgi:hypothetical protein
MKKLSQIIESSSVSSYVAKTINTLEKQGAKTEKIHNKLTKHYNFNSEEDDFHKNHIEKYTNDSSGVNHYLWMKYKGNITPENKDELEFNAFKDSSPHMKHLDKALTRFKTPMDIKVHSGTYFDPRHQQDKNGIVHHPAYLSASLLHQQALYFAPSIKPEKTKDFIPLKEKHVLTIHVPKGSRGAYVSHISYSPAEREFILPRGSNLKYNHTETVKESNPYDGNINIHTHHMTLEK